MSQKFSESPLCIHYEAITIIQYFITDSSWYTLNQSCKTLKTERIQKRIELVFTDLHGCFKFDLAASLLQMHYERVVSHKVIFLLGTSFSVPALYAQKPCNVPSLDKIKYYDIVLRTASFSSLYPISCLKHFGPTKVGILDRHFKLSAYNKNYMSF